MKTPKFWQAVNSRSNFSAGDVQKNNDEKVDCKNSSKLFIRKDDNFEHLYVKKIRNTVAIPRRGTEDAAGYDIASTEETVVPAKGKTVVKTSISIAVPDGCYGRLALRSGLAVKKYIDVGAGVIDADYRPSAVCPHSLGVSDWVVGPNWVFCESVRPFVVTYTLSTTKYTLTIVTTGCHAPL